ncbi:DUF805 domain-containing protein [Microvirga alba]|uniref:DUF805 domain-containing protein n=1 Tax=Microvirga alba TaxID=2791025 RepID=A0A931FNH3_9HYPH|nr:DUF805 domain-containing protein [Microvirga alba]MBF9233675.1 DUF805 domain-containing protein [Microvirga alba]
MELLQHLFGFSGRMNRAVFWKGLICNILIGIALDQLAPLADSVFGSLLQEIGFEAIGLALLAHCVSLWTRRLHDRDKSGWWQLLHAIPFAILVVILKVFANSIGETGDIALFGERAKELLWFPAPAFMLIAWLGIVSIWFLIQLGFLRGTVGPNRFGPDPLGEAQPAMQLQPIGD